MVIPDLIYTPPQEPLYQFQFAPVPRLPPVEPIVVEAPTQIADGDPDADTGAIESEFTVTITEAHAVVLQAPSALTQ